MKLKFNFTDKPYPKRTIIYADGRNHFFQYDPNDIPVQWQAWLRNTRPNPPTLEEIEQDKIHQERVQALAMDLSKKEADQKLFKIPNTSNPSESFEPKGWNSSPRK